VAPLFDAPEHKEPNSEDSHGEETEIYHIPPDDVSVELCCPNVVVRLLPCLNGGNSGTCWIAWDKCRNLGSRYTLILKVSFY
jgi:hypothetical protein